MKTFFFLWVCCLGASAQFAPPAMYPGSTAMHKDSNAFVAWANACTVTRGWQNMADTALGKAAAGDPSDATGPAMSNGTVSLGDGGTAVLAFTMPITNGPGWDFAVFENAFNDSFLELAFVEVSSDGQNFYRFQAQYTGDTLNQYSNNAWMDATRINNLAGKYRVGFGVPFDLEELKNLPGLDVSRISHLRIMDVTGSVDSQYLNRDSRGRPINDPWPTPFATSGFDLDAVGVIHEGNWALHTSGNISAEAGEISFYPNPCPNRIRFTQPSTQGSFSFFTITDLSGKLLVSGHCNDGADISHLPNAIYLLHFQERVYRLIKQ